MRGRVRGRAVESLRSGGILGKTNRPGLNFNELHGEIPWGPPLLRRLCRRRPPFHLRSPLGGLWVPLSFNLQAAATTNLPQRRSIDSCGKNRRYIRMMNGFSTSDRKLARKNVHLIWSFVRKFFTISIHEFWLRNVSGEIFKKFKCVIHTCTHFHLWICMINDCVSSCPLDAKERSPFCMKIGYKLTYAFVCMYFQILTFLFC